MEKQRTKEWISILEKIDPKSGNAGLASRMIRLVALPRRQRVKVDLKKLNTSAEVGSNMVVPGKILGTGSIDKKFTFTAIEISLPALMKLKDAGCTPVHISEMLKKENLKLVI